MNFFDVLNELMKERKVSKSKLGLEIGLSKDTVSSWYKRGNIPKDYILDKLASYFGVSTDYLLGRTDDPAPLNAVVAASANPDVENMSTSDLVKFISQASKELEKRTDK